MTDFFRDTLFTKSNEFNGYGPSPIPNPIDSRISELLEKWCSLNNEDRIRASESLTLFQSTVIKAFSERMASRAVRTRSRKDLLLGLIATGIDSWRYEWRDNVILLNLLYNSAINIKEDPKKIFTEASEYFPEGIKERFFEFLKRNPKDKSLAVMGYSISSDADGFRYKRNW